MRRGKAGGELAKGRRGKAIARKPRNEPAVSALAERSSEQFDDLKRERDEAHEQQAATAEVLRVIRSSPADVQPVFDMIAESAARLCEAQFCFVYRFDGRLLHFVAHHSLTAEVLEINKRSYPAPPSRGSVAARAVLERSVVEIPDVSADPDYALGTMAAAGGYRSAAAVPIMRDGLPIGSIAITRAQAGRLPVRQLDLLKTFADQAVIAIENARLLSDLRESLEQQTATSQVLQVISSSPGELERVFRSILENATRICEAKFGTLFLHDDKAFRYAADVGAPPAYTDFQRTRGAFRTVPGSQMDIVLNTKRVSHTPDYSAEEVIGLSGQLAGARSTVSVPMLKDKALVGVIQIFRFEIRPFTDKQIALLENFAAQAVIAIENARLLNELRERTDDLSEALERQTATAEVLQVVSSSPGELRPVFQAMLERATRICEAKFGALYLYEEEKFRLVATNGIPVEAAAKLQSGPRRVRPITALGRVAATRETVHIADVQSEPGYFEVPLGFTPPQLSNIAGVRTIAAVPMLRENDLVGAIIIYRQEVRPFTDKQIALLTNFAAQAVIAIENARLLNELRQRTDDLTESLEQQTATSEILTVISNSLTDTQPTFDAIVQSGLRLFPDATVTVVLTNAGMITAAAIAAPDPARVKAWRNTFPYPLTRQYMHGRAILDRKLVEFADVENTPTDLAVGAKNFLSSGHRAITIMPMIRGDEAIGAISVVRLTAGPLSDKQLAVLRTFANQAVIAIENTRLLNELRESLQQQTATADVLKVISRSTFDLRSVLQTLVESAARLCDAEKGVITREKNGAFYRAEAYGFSRDFMDFVKDIPIKPERGSVSGRALLDGRVIHIADVKADPEYTFEGQRFGNYRTALGVPMLREGVPIGVLSLTRTDVRPFTERQLELVTTFADQAAIAIENARLFESVESRTRELTKSLDDLRTTQDRLVQTEKLASLGQLTAGIAHEIKNPLNFVNNFSGVSVELIDELQETLSRVKVDDKTHAEIVELAKTLRGNLDKIVQHGKRADSIVKNMLLHSRQGSAEHRPVDINALVEESLNLAYHGARAEQQGFNITLERSLDPAAGEADVFPQDITRVLLNLISNGFYAAIRRKAQADGGDHEPTLVASTWDLGERVEIRIRDNGTGIPPEVKEQMFNPFFTTKPAGEGTGLGLSISHDIIVKQHGGSIEVDTQPGAYTEFRIILPRKVAILGEGEASA